LVGALQLGQQAQTVHIRHINVGQDKIQGMVPDDLQSLEAVAGLKYLFDRQGGLAQHPDQDLPNGGGIVYD
jgi:hypothetical protein